MAEQNSSVFGSNGSENNEGPEMQPGILQGIMATLEELQRRNEQLETQVTNLTNERNCRNGDRGMAEMVVNFQPFSEEIEEAVIPDNCKSLIMEAYTGDADPKEHLVYFNTKMVINGATDAVKCKLLPSTFKKSAMTWFTTLPARSIINFTELSSKFLSQFSSNQAQKVTPAALFNILQKPGESLKEYMGRFNEVSVHMEDNMPTVCVAAFENGLRAGSLNSDLTRRPVQSMDELRRRAQEFIMEEEVDKMKRARDAGRPSGVSSREGQRREERASRNKYDPGFQPRSFHPTHKYAPQRTTPYQARPLYTLETEMRDRAIPVTLLTVSMSQLYREIASTNLLREPPPPKRPPANVDTTKWCEYHRAVGHDTNDCWTLRRAIEELIKAGHLKKYLKQREDRSDPGKTNKDSIFGSPKGRVNSIAGGFSGGGTSSSARKRYARTVNMVREGDYGFKHPAITFTMEDFLGTTAHEDDPMVVTLRIAGYDVRRVLLDQGSSADIIYGDAFEKLGFKDEDLLEYDGALVGFSGEQVIVRGYIELYTIFGRDRNAEHIKVKYLVISCTSSYNVIIGRSSLNCLGAIISTAHLAMKYPLDNGEVGVLKADQDVARRCYRDSLKGQSYQVEQEKTMSCNEIGRNEVLLDPRGEDCDELRAQPAEELKEIQAEGRIFKVGAKLEIKLLNELCDLLARNQDLFAWTIKDVPGIDPNFICHILSVTAGSKPIAQRKRKMGEDRREAIKVETQKLEEAGFIREIKYPTWLSNVVMVRKANGKWRMCTDYTDLNKACPKDSYPLPNIDKLVDGASGQGMLSFMDAYSGYHQIRMHPSDEAKTTFMTKSELTDANQKSHTMSSAAIASAAALVASHCIEIAEDMGAEHDQIATAVNSAINAKTNGDIMTLTAGAATALRGAVTLKARLQKGLGITTLPLVEEKYDEGKEAKILTAVDYVFTGGELLKCTRKGALHWKQVSFNVDSNLQVAVKMKSKYMAGTFTKKKKCIVNGVCSDIPAWPGRGKEHIGENRAYFGIKTADRIIEFECGSKGDKQFWLEGIQYMLKRRAKVAE